MTLSYHTARLGSAGAGSATEVQALQHDLRSLGYLRRGIDGAMGNGTRQAIRSLQVDLLRNQGQSTGHDGAAPVRVAQYNRGVAAVSGVVDAATADSIEAMLLDAAFPKVPRSADAAAENRQVLSALSALRSAVAPVPFLLAMFQQESDSCHFAVPSARDADDFVIVGLDRNDKADHDVVTSRGYGIGQYTLFHHPATGSELTEFVVSPVSNIGKAEHDLAAKFRFFLVGHGAGERALDRDREHPVQLLRPCRYGVADPRYLSDCRACAQQVRKLTLTPSTPVYAGADQTYGSATYYPPTTYTAIPDRAAFLCDWPYAVRRYNGEGPESYHYQARILRNLVNLPASTA